MEKVENAEQMNKENTNKFQNLGDFFNDLAKTLDDDEETNKARSRDWQKKAREIGRGRVDKLPRAGEEGAEETWRKIVGDYLVESVLEELESKF